MDNDDKLFYVRVILMIVLVSCALAVPFPCFYIMSQVENANAFQGKLELSGFQVKAGIVDSPALIIPVVEADFLTRAHESPYPIYRDGLRFYAFNAEMTTAYRYVA